MKKKNFMVKSFARNVQVKNHDLRRDYGLDPCADREMTTLENKVSPQLYGMLIQQLLGFHADMQYEMAVDLVIFAYQHIANSTGCPAHCQLNRLPFCGFHPRCVLHMDCHRARYPEAWGQKFLV